MSVEDQMKLSPRIFAFIIGINQYSDPQIEDLRGSVRDAKAVRKFLKNKLGVNDRNIRMLSDLEATRENIIQAFVALQTNRDIRRGDAILIYYAGHGQEVEVPDDWPTEDGWNIVQSIVPCDFTSNGNVHVIPDRTIGRLLRNIMIEKGDNITVIFDCCNAGSGTRSLDSPVSVRSAMLKNYALPAGLDDDIIDMHQQRAAVQHVSGSLASHVFLAACSASERAIEINGRGQFTRALLKVLNSVPISEISYVDLMDRLEQLVFQNPQLEGVNRHRILFNGKVLSPTRNVFKVDLNPNAQYVLRAGAAHGVSPKAEFTLYADAKALSNQEPCGVSTVLDVGPFQSTLSQPINPTRALGQSPIAVQSKSGVQEQLRVHVPEEALLQIFNEASLVQTREPLAGHQIRFSLADKLIADIEARRQGDDIAFYHLDERVTAHGLTRCIHTANSDPASLCRILQGAATYYYHLNRSYLTSDNLRKSLRFEFFKLQPSWQHDEDGALGWMPMGENLIKDGIITLEIDDAVENLYGIRVTNYSGTNLYPNIFYFDNSELSIESYYSTTTENHFLADSPLPKEGGQINIGFGNGGANPIEYFIPDGHDVDVGFLKFFFSTSPIDLSPIAQSSPFKILRDTETSLPYTDPNKSDAWCSVLIPIVQKRIS
ncbi:Metacaspase-1 [Psilocybe cubensis]|uniref:Metacaspase-1 n=1 Tax=Psilocybe cubensis TaxID=181762 RepID=A0ACB8HDW0_PSICU|nr:Metacaspase-1 [Psilocybe cubensis]KAH9485842.1 Metacaspase-1 [Psilocybe cubensis]